MSPEDERAFATISQALLAEEPQLARMGSQLDHGRRSFPGGVYVAAFLVVFAAVLAILLIPVR